MASCNEQATSGSFLHLDPLKRELQPLQLPNFHNLHRPFFGAGVDKCSQKTAEMYAIWPLSLKRQKQSPVNPFLLPILNIPYVLPVPSLRKSGLVSSQHQYIQQPGQLYQTSCFLDWRITKSRQKSNTCLWSIAAAWFWRWSLQIGWRDNSVTGCLWSQPVVCVY